MVVRPVVLDERWDWRDVAGVHRGHAGSSADRGGLVVQVQHSGGRHRQGRRRGFSVQLFETFRATRRAKLKPHFILGRENKKQNRMKKVNFLMTKEPEF